MKDRIKQIMEAQHMTQQTFANFIGMSPASLSSIFNDRTKPTINTVEAIKSKMPAISTDWLMFGRGTMFVDEVEGNDAVQKEKTMADMAANRLLTSWMLRLPIRHTDKTIVRRMQGVSPILP